MLLLHYIFFELVRYQHRIYRLCKYSRLWKSFLLNFKITHRIFGSSSIYLTELTFWLSNISLNWFLYKSKHLAKFSMEKRLTYSSFLSTIFNFGSIMIVNNLNHFFGRIEFLRIISSLTLSSCLLSIGYVYLEDLE